VRIVGAGLLLALGAIQLVPYGPYDLPAPRAEPAWDSQRTRELTVRACYDCHSNEVVWPWYSRIAPVSWLVRRDVDLGRAELNFSEPGGEAEDAAESVSEGEMPPALYTLVQGKARLTTAEVRDLVTGLTATFGGEGDGRRDGDEDDD